MPGIDEYTIGIGQRIVDAIEQIERNQARTVIVVDGERAVGVLSEGDVMRALLKGIDVHAPLTDVVRYDFRYLVEEDWNLALDLMRRHGITLLAIVDERSHLVGAVSLQDVLQRVRIAEG
jgi:arabinose-5-phosphate isomerase